MKQIKLTIAVVAMLQLSFSNKAFSQYMPSYPYNMNHPTWMTAYSFSDGNTDYLRGFAFAWDATSPITQGQTVAVWIRTIPTSDLTGTVDQAGWGRSNFNFTLSQTS